MHTMHLLHSVAIRPNLELKTRPKELLGSLLLVIALPNNREYIDRQLIGTAHMPCFGKVIMLPATILVWYHNLVQKINFMVLFTT